ncbi:MAG: hypothetical protein WCK28_00710 [Burkholderiales bacterium]
MALGDDVAGRPMLPSEQPTNPNLLRELPAELCRLLALAVEHATPHERVAMLPELTAMRDATDARRFLRSRGWVVGDA